MGLASLEHDIPIRRDTVFHAASLAKQFTAAAAHLLERERRFGLDDPVRRHIPELPACCDPIRLHHLLHHTSGLRDQWDLLFLAGWRPEDVVTSSDVLGLLRRQTDLNFAPGFEHLYCNTGYTLLATAIERVLDRSLDDVCRERLFAPAGMSDSRFQHDHTAVVSGRASSYMASAQGGFRSAGLHFAIPGATNLLTTVDDLSSWEAAVHSGIMSEWGIGDAVHTPGTLADGRSAAYGAGLRLSRDAAGTVAYHNGADAGFRCHVVRALARGRSVIVLGNVSDLYPAELAVQVDGVASTGTGSESDRRWMESLSGIYWNESTGVGCEVECTDCGPVLRGYGVYPMVTTMTWGCFRLKGYPETRLSFAMEGGTIRLTEETPGARPMIYERFPEAAAPAVDPHDYAGSYACPQIAAEYQILEVEGGLKIGSSKHVTAPVRWVGPDRCICAWEGYGGAPPWVGSIRFRRNSRKKVIGFDFSTLRTRSLRFERLRVRLR